MSNCVTWVLAIRDDMITAIAICATNMHCLQRTPVDEVRHMYS